MIMAKEHYYTKLQDFSYLYSQALTADSNIVADAWSTDFSSMIGDSTKLESSVNKYINGSKTAF
jgi:hypothetical protein